MKLAVHVKAGVFNWSEGTSHSSQFLSAAKQQLQNRIFKDLGIQWDVVDKTGRGGTTTTGNVARRLLHSGRHVILSEIPDDFKETFKHLGQHLSIILRVVSSKEKVNVEMYKQMCLDLYKFLLENFPRVVNKLNMNQVREYLSHQVCIS